MTKSDLISTLAERFPQLTRPDVDAAVATILDAVRDSLVRGGRTEIRGFGSFQLSYRPPRVGRNPKTGEQVSVPGKWTPHFKAGRQLRELVDTPRQGE